MKIFKKATILPSITAEVPASKSLSNRLLLLKQMYHLPIKLEGLSEANDTKILSDLLLLSPQNKQVYDVQDAGTVCRFMTAFLASRPSDCIVTGTKRMLQRPIKDLVEMLIELGADIHYLEAEGHLPLHIKGKYLKGGKKIVSKSNISSQFYSAIAMIAPGVENGLQIELPKQMLSKSYFEMTLHAMKLVGLEWKKLKNETYEFSTIKEKRATDIVSIETDWSGASYFIFLPLLYHEVKIFIPNLEKFSLQGDAKFIESLLPLLGLEIEFQTKGVVVSKKGAIQLSEIDFSLAPDISLNLLMVLALTRQKLQIKGLQTLYVKESNRVSVLKMIFDQIGVQFSEVSDGVWDLDATKLNIPKELQPFSTFNDHRVAMALSYIAFKVPIEIQFPDVVTKSYPGFWNQVKKTIFDLEQ